MKFPRAVLALVAWVTVLPALAAGMEGNWSGVIAGSPVGPDPIAFEFTVAGGKLGGTVRTSTLGSARIDGGVIQEGRLSFTARFSPEVPGLTPFTVKFEGATKGDELDLVLRVAPDAGTAFRALARRAESAAGMSWDSIRTLPDFSGPWNMGAPPANPAAAQPPPLAPYRLLPALAEAAGRMAALEREGVDPASQGLERVFCSPPKFTASNKNDVHDYFEILFTPGRVTITNELGLVRRIRLGASLPVDPEPSDAGTSVAYWGGDILVVETVGLKANTVFQRNPALKFGKGARVIERIRLVQPDVLEVYTRLTAPELLAAPYESRMSFARYRDHELQPLSNCVEDDRSYDNRTGREQFDLTPPPDLPPPPSREGTP